MPVRWQSAIALIAMLLVATSCAPSAGQPSPTGLPSAVSTAATASAPVPGTDDVSPSNAATSSPPGETFTNPVIKTDFPDPYVVSFEGSYHAYATGSAGKSIQVSTSPDLVTWSPPAEALSRQPRWMAGATWAPEVYETSAGYVMYYSGRSAIERPNNEGALCLSTAVADDPAGAFTDQSEEPLVCQPELGGSIDPTVFTSEDGTRYLIWKNDGNCCAIPTRFWLQELSDDGLSLVGNQPVDLGVENDAAWEGGVIEAPTLLEREGTYYLFYSGNVYDTHRYAVGVATSESLTGPYTDAEQNPILSTQRPAVAVGPGHQSIVADDEGDLWLAYHAWDVNAIGYQLGGRRALWIDELIFGTDTVDILGPDAGPQALP